MAKRRGLILPRQAELPACDVVEVGGLSVTSPLRTAFDLARRQPLTEAVVAVDGFLHAGLVHQSALLGYAAEHHGWRGIHRVPRILDLAEPLTESPMESRLRMVLMILGGLPRPAAQVVVRIAGSTYRLDLAYPFWRIAIEFAGRVHDGAAKRISDTRRRNRLGRAHWRLLTYSAQDVYLRPEAIVREVLEAIAESA